MLSAVIHSAHSYPAYPLGRRTGIPAVRPSESSRTTESSSQCSNAYTGYGPNCLTHKILLLLKGMDYIFTPISRGLAFYAPSKQKRASRSTQMLFNRSLYGDGLIKTSRTVSMVIVRFVESFNAATCSTNSTEFRKLSIDWFLDKLPITRKAKRACLFFTTK